MKKRILSFILATLVLILTVPITSLAETNGTFSELQNLIDDATGTLKLEKDYTNSGSESQITISNKTITIDLNGHVINGNRAGRVFYVDNNSNLTITDSNPSAEHKFSIGNYLLATLDESNGTLTVNGGCITGGSIASGNSYGSGLYINNATLNLNAGNIIGNTIAGKTQHGTGISGQNNAKIIINGGSVSYNSASWEGYGGGINVENSELILNDGSISYNCGIYGGGIFASNGGKIEINGGSIKGNQAYHNGAGIAIFDATAIINDGIIEENIVPETYIGIGGGISTNIGADLTINGGIIRNNQANRGAGIGVWTGGNIKIYGGQIINNISTEDTTPTDVTKMNYGAGIFFDSSYTGYSCEVPTLTLGGDVVITGNTNSVTNTEENVYFTADQKINIATDDHAPTSGMQVGVTMNTPGIFTTAADSDYSTYFTSDDAAYAVDCVLDNHSLKLTEAVTVTFDSNGGSDVEALSIPKGKAVTQPTDPTKEGYSFYKWLDKDGNPFDFSTPITEDITLKASWLITSYSVKYYKCAGDELPVQTQTIAYNYTPKEVANPTRKGYIFKGWYYNGEPFDFNTKVTCDMDVYAEWNLETQDYKITEGATQLVVPGYVKSALFRSNAEYAKFVSVEVDGKILDALNYTSKEGSTIIELKPEYLSTLSVGKHTIRIVSTDGYAETYFYIEDEAIAPTDGGLLSEATMSTAFIAASIVGLSSVIYTTRKRKSWEKS